jgi:Tfp pilus assembly protein PilN
MRWDFTARERGEGLDISVALMQVAVLDELVALFSAAGIPLAGVFPTCMLLAGLIPAGGVAAVAHPGGQEAIVWNGHRVCWQSAGSPDSGVLATAAAMLENYGITSRRAVVLGSAPVDTPQGLELERVTPEALEYGLHQSFCIDLVPESAIRRLRRLQFAALAATVALLLTIVLQPFQDVFLWKRRIVDIEGRVAALKDEAESLITLRQGNSEIRDRLEAWGKRLSGHMPATEVLGEVTRLLPPEAWLESLQIQDGKVILNGNAPSATFVLEQLENSAVFEGARFDAPVTSLGQQEVFRIVATISPK